MGVNIFQNRKALKLFAEISDALEGKERKAFTEKVMQLFEDKVVSEEGEYQEFKITEADVKRIARELKV